MESLSSSKTTATQSLSTDQIAQLTTTFLNVASIGMGILDEQENIVYVNEFLAKNLGYDEQELIGQNIAQITLIKEPDQIISFRKQLNSIRNVTDYTTLIRKDGTLYSALTTTTLVTSESVDSKTYYCTCFIELSDKMILDNALRDNQMVLESIIDNKTKELNKTNEVLQNKLKELSDSEHLFNLISEYTDEIIWVTDAKQKTLFYSNHAFENLFGFTYSHMIDHKKSFIDLVHKDDQATVLDAYTNHFESLDIIFRVIGINGTHWVHQRTFPIKDCQDKIHRIIGFSTDITAQKQQEEMISQSEKQFLLADKMASLGTLASGIAHEINNPNNLIMLSTDLLKELWDEIQPIINKYYMNTDNRQTDQNSEMIQNIPQLFENIIGGSERIGLIINALKDFIKIDVTNAPTEFNINNVIESALYMTDNLIKKSSGTLVVSLTPDLPDITGISQQIQQALINLITNACQAQIDINHTISITSEINEHKKMIQVSITDEGEGIPEENLSQIMNPFFTTRRTKGNIGLGLSVTYNIIRNHNGTLHFSSIPGFGTKATLSLPCKLPARE
jgi:PAS domain S-box-containing protein